MGGQPRENRVSAVPVENQAPKGRPAFGQAAFQACEDGQQHSGTRSLPGPSGPEVQDILKKVLKECLGPEAP